MSLTENEKKIVRKIIRDQPDAYCEQVAADDDFARQEIDAKKPQLLVDAINRVNMLTQQKNRVEADLAKAQAEQELLGG